MRWGVVAVAACIALTGCATVNYLSNEYGTAPKDGTVTLEDGSGWWIWVHKTKAKLIVSVDLNQATGIGLASGLTFGAINNAPPPPVFEKVAARWFAEHRPECHTTKGYPIDRVYYEFDYECAPSPGLPAGPKPKR